MPAEGYSKCAGVRGGGGGCIVGGGYGDGGLKVESGGGGGGRWRGGWAMGGKSNGPAKLNIRKHKYFILPPPGIAEAGPPHI